MVPPAAATRCRLVSLGTVLAQVARWVLLVALVIVALAVVYRLAPDRDAPKFRWASPGPVVATVLVGHSAASVQPLREQLRQLQQDLRGAGRGGRVPLWLYLTSYIVLLGAEINAESERQTRVDTTTGPAEPMGQRRAEAADTLADPPEPAAQR